MLRVTTEFVMRMKEEKDPTLYKTYISLAINCVGVVDMSVRDTTVNDVWQMIRDKKYTYITGEDDEESEEEDLIGAQDIEKTFKPEEMTAEVKDRIAKCFEEISKAHEAIKKVYKSAVKLVPKLSSKRMGVFLEALALGTLDIPDTRVANILQDARLNRKLREEVKTTDNVSLFDKCKEMQKNRMLPDWMHPIFKQKAKYWPVGKIAVAVMVFLLYTMGEKAKDVTLTTISELFPIGEQQTRKVAMGKLYDTKGKCIEGLFLKMGRAYGGDPINWKQEAKEVLEVDKENIIYEFMNKAGPDAPLPLAGTQIKASELRPVEAVVPKSRYFPRTAGESPQPVVRVMISQNEGFANQLVQQVPLPQAHSEIYRQIGVDPFISEGSEEHDTLEALDTAAEKVITRVLGMAIREESKDEDIPAKMRSHSRRMSTATVTSSSQPSVLLETIDLCSSDEGENMEEGDIATISTVVQLRKEPTTEVPPADDNDEESSSSSEDDPDDDDDGEDLFDIEALQKIYEEHWTDQPKEVKPMEEGWEEMDTSEATEEPVKLVKPTAVPTKQKATPTVMVKKSERPRVEKSTIPTFHISEPVMNRAREKEKTLGERLLAEFERVEAEEKVKKKAEEDTQMKGKHHRRTKSKVEQTPPRKPKDLERMDMEELEGPSSRQVTPAEKSILSNRYTAEMSLEEVQLPNKLIEPKEWDLDNLDDVYVSLDRYCELRRQRKGLDEGDLPEVQFRTMAMSRLSHFQMAKALLDQRRKQELQHMQCKGTPK